MSEHINSLECLNRLKCMEIWIWQLGMSEQTGVSEDLDSEGCLSSIKSTTKERNWSEPERIKIPQSEKLFVVVVGGWV